jgi:hypothetical protein
MNKFRMVFYTVLSPGGTGLVVFTVIFLPEPPKDSGSIFGGFGKNRRRKSLIYCNMSNYDKAAAFAG